MEEQVAESQFDINPDLVFEDQDLFSSVDDDDIFLQNCVGTQTTIVHVEQKACQANLKIHSSMMKHHSRWKHRKPPDGVLEHQLMMCIMPQPCIFGSSCLHAHSSDELNEWKIRLNMETQSASYKEGDFSLEDHRMNILDKLNASDKQDDGKSVLTELIGGHSILCDENLFIMHVDKNKELAWMFTVTCHKEVSDQKLERVFFLNDCADFSMEYIFFTETEFIKLPPECKVWENRCKKRDKTIRVLLRFCAKKYGNYCQEIVFDFGGYPKVVRKLGVQVATEQSLEQTMKYNPDKYENNELSWLEKHKAISFDGSVNSGLNELTYRLPANIENLVMFDAFKHLDATLTKQNYRTRLHTLLYIEEYQRRANLQSITFHLEDIRVCSEKKKEVDRNYTASIIFEDYMLEDLTRLVGKSGKALVRLNCYEKDGCVDNDIIVYEVIIKNIQNNTLVLELNGEFSTLVRESAIPVDVDVCFCLIDVFQTLHKAIDQVNLELLFPTVLPSNYLPYPDRSGIDLSLSKEQSRAVNVILDTSQRAPVLVLGPFGAGKTRTLARVVEQLITDKIVKNRVLICTHSNSAADYYIEEYFHPLHNLDQKPEDIDPALIPLRLNWEHRYTSSVSDKVLAYCFQDKSTGLFAIPSKEHLDKHSIIISTLVTSFVLSTLNLPQDYFTHIIIDEAAQAMEVEAIVPFMLASENTKTVLAGDHMQMSEPITSSVAKDLGLGRSLLERLFQRYPFDAECKLKLLENFRSYKDIVDLASHLFYEDALVSNKTQTANEKYPIEFHGVNGVETLSKENPSFENVAEATEIMLRVTDIIKFWDDKDVEFNLASICVVSFYPAQVRRIRKILRRNDMSGVRVESVNNIQGLEFDVLIISTVRTYCEATIFDDHMMKDMGFLTNPKLLNTAITRARFQAIMIGDPVALCTIGECIPCWKTIIRKCNEKSTFSYTDSYDQLLQRLKNVLNENSNKNGVSSDMSAQSDDQTTFQSHSHTSLFASVPSPPPPYTPQDISAFNFFPRYMPHLLPIQSRFSLGYSHATHHMMNRPFYRIIDAPIHRFQAPCHFIPHRHGEHSYFAHCQVPRPFMDTMYPRPGFFPYFRANLLSPFSNHERCIPRAKNITNLRQKIQFVQEYSIYLMDCIHASANVKDVIKSRMGRAFSDVQTLSDGRELSDVIQFQVMFDNIEKNVENSYLFSENQYAEYIRAMNGFDPSEIQELKKSYGILKRQVSEVNAFVEHEEYKRDVLHEYEDANELKEKLATFSYFLQLVHHEMEVSLHLLSSRTLEVLLPRKLEFLLQQIEIVEANRELLEETINVRSVDMMEERDNAVSQGTEASEGELQDLQFDVVTLDNDTTDSSLTKNLTMCDIGALENKLAASTIEDEDPDLVQWFSKRKNDPCVQEYVTTHTRKLAERVPSPKALEENSTRNFPRCRVLEKCKKHDVKKRCARLQNCDYAMHPPYKPYVEDEETKQDVFRGVIKYQAASDHSNVHGTVFVNNGVQVHVNGLRRNNRALPGDTVLVKCKIHGDKFDIPGEVIKVIKRASLIYYCKKVSEDLVQPINEQGPAVLLIRGVKTTRRVLEPDHEYGVKIIDWPEEMMFPLGEIVKV